MNVLIGVRDWHSDIHPTEPGLYQFEHDIILPEKIELIFQGKDMSKDTVCDARGNIMQDKCVIIKKITLDNFVVDQYYIQKHLTLQIADSDQSANSNYVGHNGRMILDLDRSNVFFLINQMKRLGAK